MAVMKVCLALTGDNFDTCYVTKKTGIQPHTVRERDEVLGNGRPFGYTQWCVESERVSTDRSDSLVDSFISGLHCERDSLLKISRECSARWHLFVEVDLGAAGDYPSLVFSPEAVEFGSALGADMWFDVFSSCEDMRVASTSEEKVRITAESAHKIGGEADIHGSRLLGYSYDAPDKSLVLNCDSFRLKRKYHIRFNNVIYTELLCSNFTEGYSKITFWELVPAQWAFKRAGLSDLSMKKSRYISSVAAISTGKALLIICESIDYEALPLESLYF